MTLPRLSLTLPQTLIALLAAALIAIALFGLARDRAGVTIEAVTVDGTPATVFRTGPRPAPVVLIAHGFAGSQQLMQSFALQAAESGMIAVTFDFLGHGRNPAPLGGSVTEIGGATRSLVAQTARMAGFARSLGDGRVALLGHSMASDVIIRVAQAEPDIVATVAISAFSQVVTPESPRNLLLVAGEWEPYLISEALKLIGQSAGPTQPEAGVTYGDMARGNARRLAVAPNVEHVGVLYSSASLSEAQAWLSSAFGLRAAMPPVRTGAWICLLLGGLILAVKPLSRFLPAVSSPQVGGGLPWRRFWLVALVPAIATPLILRVVPTRFLPILVADYLVLHFALYGLLTFVLLRVSGTASPRLGDLFSARMAAAMLAALAISFGGLFFAIDTFVTSLAPIQARIVLILLMLAGTTSYFFATEWAMRGPHAARGAAIALPAAFLVSLALAVALDLKRLFFLAIIVPVIVPFLLVFGLFAHWVHARTGHPMVGAAVQAATFALAIGATFPLMTG